MEAPVLMFNQMTRNAAARARVQVLSAVVHAVSTCGTGSSFQKIQSKQRFPKALRPRLLALPKVRNARRGRLTQYSNFPCWQRESFWFWSDGVSQMETIPSYSVARELICCFSGDRKQKKCDFSKSVDFLLCENCVFLGCRG